MKLTRSCFCEGFLSAWQDQLEFKEDLPLSHYSTMRVGGTATLAAFPNSGPACTALLRYCRTEGIPYSVFGKGSNTLFLADRYDKLAIFTTGMTHCAREGDIIFADAGVSVPYLCRFAAENGLSGLSALSGIPGTVGGLFAMNAGAFGVSASDLSAEILLFNPALPDDVMKVTSADMQYGNRDSICLAKNGTPTVLSVKFSLQNGDRNTILAKMEEYKKRRASQPLDMPSLGSVFKRPENGFAGKYIEEAGLKGLSFGGAKVSEKHAGFIVNTGNATAFDVYYLMETVQEKVNQKFGVALVPEIRVIR